MFMEQARLRLNDEILKFLEEEFEINDLNFLPEKYGGGKIFEKPLIGVARAEDTIFQKYKETLGSEHLTPLEIWLACAQDYVSISELCTMSIVFPFTQAIRRSCIDHVQLRRII
jgi:hypothetical protein